MRNYENKGKLKNQYYIFFFKMVLVKEYIKVAASNVPVVKDSARFLFGTIQIGVLSLGLHSNLLLQWDEIPPAIRHQCRGCRKSSHRH